MSKRRLLEHKFLVTLIIFGAAVWMFYIGVLPEIHLISISGLVDHIRQRVEPINNCRLSFLSNGHQNMTLSSNCTVPVYLSSEGSSATVMAGSCVPCDRKSFKNYHSQSSNFLSDGFWNIDVVKEKPKHFSFQPSFCKFSTKDLDSAYIRKCLSEKNVTKIITMGDSNGKRTFIGLKTILSSGIQNCKLIREERGGKDRFWPGLHYYLGSRKYNLSQDVGSYRRMCMTCRAELNRCSYNVVKNSTSNQKRTLILEHLAMNELFGNNMRVFRTIQDMKPTNYTQEIIFNYYLKNSYPDILILIVPCVHEILASNLDGGNAGARMRGLLGQLLTLLKNTVPKSTHIYWIPAHYFYGQYQEKTILCNKILFETLKSELSAPDTNMHATLGLFEIGCPMKWLRSNKDTVHMNPTWYTVVASHLMQQFCN